MKRNSILVLIVTFVLSGTFLLHFAKAGEGTLNQKYVGELAVAKAIDILIRSARAKYTQNVVGKLKNDATGASVNYRNQKGYIPLPAQYVRAIADDIVKRQIEGAKGTFNFFLRSRWNLNVNQGLQDDFEKKGWDYLIRQEVEAFKAGTPLKKIEWKPYVRVEDFNGQKMLRYLSADPGSAISCITCHNRWERKPEIKKLREKQGVEVGKIFQMHELMGALSINVALGNK
jgi:hypothetical protein